MEQEGQKGQGAFTPGPWVSIGTDPAEGGDWFWIKTQPNPALRGFTKDIAAVNGSQTDPERVANALLISTAPELLVALVEAEDAIADMIDGSAANHPARMVLARTRAAILKATRGSL